MDRSDYDPQGIVREFERGEHILPNLAKVTLFDSGTTQTNYVKRMGFALIIEGLVAAYDRVEWSVHVSVQHDVNSIPNDPSY